MNVASSQRITVLVADANLMACRLLAGLLERQRDFEVVARTSDLSTTDLGYPEPRIWPQKDRRPKVGGDPLDDVMDSARYGLCSWITAAEKPFEMRRAQALRPFVENMRDPSLSRAERMAVATSALIRDSQMTEGYERTGRPAVLGRHGRR